MTATIDTIPAATHAPEPRQSEARATLKGLLPILWESVPEHAFDYSQVRRAAGLIIHRDIDPGYFTEAMEACEALWKIAHGDCLVHMYGDSNTEERRLYWQEQEEMNLSCAISNIVSGVKQ